MWNLKVGDLPDKHAREPVPEGTYPFVIEDAQPKMTQSGHLALNIKLICTSPTFSGRSVYQLLNVSHPNDTPRSIALESLKQYMLAAGYGLNDVFTEGAQLIGHECLVEVGVRSYVNASGETRYSNEVKSVSPPLSERVSNHAPPRSRPAGPAPYSSTDEGMPF